MASWSISSALASVLFLYNVTGDTPVFTTRSTTAWSWGFTSILAMKIGSFDDEGCSISHVPLVVEWIQPVISISLLGGMLTLSTNVILLQNTCVLWDLAKRGTVLLAITISPLARFKTHLFASRKSKPRIASAVICSAITNLCLSVIPEIVIGIIADPNALSGTPSTPTSLWLIAGKIVSYFDFNLSHTSLLRRETPVPVSTRKTLHAHLYYMIACNLTHG